MIVPITAMNLYQEEVKRGREWSDAVEEVYWWFRANDSYGLAWLKNYWEQVVKELRNTKIPSVPPAEQ